jgi:hypothetical protein
MATGGLVPRMPVSTIPAYTPPFISVIILTFHCIAMPIAARAYGETCDGNSDDDSCIDHYRGQETRESTALLFPCIANAFRQFEITDQNKDVAKSWLNQVEPVFVVDEITTRRTPANKRHLQKRERLQLKMRSAKVNLLSLPLPSCHRRNYQFQPKSTSKKVEKEGGLSVIVP